MITKILHWLQQRGTNRNNQKPCVAYWNSWAVAFLPAFFHSGLSGHIHTIPGALAHLVLLLIVPKAAAVVIMQLGAWLAAGVQLWIAQLHFLVVRAATACATLFGFFNHRILIPWYPEVNPRLPPLLLPWSMESTWMCGMWRHRCVCGTLYHMAMLICTQTQSLPWTLGTQYLALFCSFCLSSNSLAL